MKYRFITIVHNLELENLKQGDISIKPNWILSSKKEILKETFNNNLSFGTLGAHSIDEFQNQVFFYIDEEFEKGVTKEEINKRGTRFAIALLRIIQNYVFNLWKIKDNDIYIRDGFLYVYEKKISDGVTFKGSLSAITSFSDMSSRKSIFSTKELKQASDFLEYLTYKDLFKNTFDYKIPTYDHFFKYSKAERLDRAWYFILNARATNTLPMKIVSYCTALECIFTTGRSELIHRISERVAILTENESENRVKIYNTIKKAYDIRSTIVHGAILKGKNDDLKEISLEIDKTLRNIINADFELFSKKDEELDRYFLNRLFNSEKNK